jgi:DNA-binding transcriptional LysR family regulator
MNTSSPSDQIALFVRVVERGSFAAAAKESGLTPSGVSKGVSRLEDRLGVRLLQRTTRRLAVTPEGETLLAHGREILGAIDAMEAEITATRGKPRGLVRLNVGTAYAKHCLMPSLAGFHARYPDIEIELSIDDQHVDVIGRQIDVAIRTGALGESTLVTRKLGDADRIICASRAYLRRHGKPKSPKDLGRHSCLRMTAAGRLAEWWMRTEDGLVPFRVKGWITCDSVDIMFDMVRQGMGIARLPSFLVRDDLKSGALVALMTEHHVAAPFPITALMSPGRQHLPRVRALVDHLAEHFE